MGASTTATVPTNVINVANTATTGGNVTTTLSNVATTGGNASTVVNNTSTGGSNVTVGGTVGTVGTGNIVIGGTGGNVVIGGTGGNILGNVGGNIGGNVLGNIGGNIGGNVLGNVGGNISGNGNVIITTGTTGNVLGNVSIPTGNITSNVVGNVLGNITSTVTPNVFTVINTPNTSSNLANITTTLTTTSTPMQLTAGGLNPGYIAPGDFYKTTSPVQSRFYYGQHPYQTGGPTGQVFDPVLYNTVPEAPRTPWGLQQMAAPLGANPYAPGSAVPAKSAVSPFSPDILKAPSYAAPPAGAMAPVGVQVTPAKTTPISPYVSSGTSTNTATQQLAYDQQLALAAGNNDLYWQLQARIDAAGKPTSTAVPVKP